MKLTTFTMVGVIFTAAGIAAVAGPEEVKFPVDYQTNFVAYLDVDRYDRKRVRRMYVNPEALAAAVPGQPAPDGTILIMEDHNAIAGADEALRFDENGRFIPEDAVSNIFVMEKNFAWSTANENWDYAWYGPDGKPSTSEFAQSMDGCFSCHANRTEQDFNFTFWRFVENR